MDEDWSHWITVTPNLKHMAAPPPLHLFVWLSFQTLLPAPPSPSVYELHCQGYQRLLTGVHSTSGHYVHLPGEPPGTVGSFHFCKWNKCSSPQPYYHIGSLLNIIGGCIKPRGPRLPTGKEAAPCAPGCLKPGGREMLKWQNTAKMKMQPSHLPVHLW